MSEQLYKELEELLKLPIGQNFYKYRDMYLKVFNRQAPSCKCKGNAIYYDLNNAYILRKQEYESSNQIQATN